MIPASFYQHDHLQLNGILPQPTQSRQMYNGELHSRSTQIDTILDNQRSFKMEIHTMHTQSTWILRNSSQVYQIQFPITYERRPNESPLFRLTPYANQTHNHLYLIKTTVGRRAIVELPKDIIDVE